MLRAIGLQLQQQGRHPGLRQSQHRRPNRQAAQGSHPTASVFLRLKLKRPWVSSEIQNEKAAQGVWKEFINRTAWYFHLEE